MWLLVLILVIGRGFTLSHACPTSTWFDHSIQTVPHTMPFDYCPSGHELIGRLQAEAMLSREQLAGASYQCDVCLGSRVKPADAWNIVLACSACDYHVCMDCLDA